jgi:hypothetical protein
VRRPLLIAGALVSLLVLCAFGLSFVGSESVNVVFFRHRPWLL